MAKSKALVKAEGKLKQLEKAVKDMTKRVALLTAKDAKAQTKLKKKATKKKVAPKKKGVVKRKTSVKKKVAVKKRKTKKSIKATSIASLMSDKN